VKQPISTHYEVDYLLLQDPWSATKRFSSEAEARQFYAATMADPANHSRHVMKLRHVVSTLLIDGQYEYPTPKGPK
jgi:hypothetical protein